AWVVYDLQLPQAPFGVAFGFILSSLSFFAIGFLLAGVVSSARTATVVGQVLFFPMLFLSGAAGMPREMFPDFLQRISDFLPLTYVVNLVRDLWLEGDWNLTAVLVLGLM